MNSVRIECDTDYDGWLRTRVWIDGVEQDSLKKIVFSHMPGENPKLEVEW